MKEFQILQIANHYASSGGEEASVERIADHIQDVACLERCRFRTREWLGEGGPSILHQARWMMKNPAALDRIRKVDSVVNPDFWLVHNVFPVGSAGIYSLARRLNRPVIQCLHNFRPLSINGYFWANGKISAGGKVRPYLKEIVDGAWQNSRLKTAWFGCVLARLRLSGDLRAIKAWIAPSEFVRQRFIEAGYPGERIFTLLHSWDVRGPTPEERTEDDYYLFLGRLNEQKGVRVLFEAWEALRGKKELRSPRLRICGEGPLEEWVRQKCRNRPEVSYGGRVTGDDKERMLRGARALIAPSLWWEPLGLVTYEAYDYGKPMLAARSGGLAETVTDGVTGFLHTPGDALELAEQIERLERDATLRKSMGIGGRKWLLKNTDPADWNRKFLRVADFVREEQKPRP